MRLLDLLGHSVGRLLRFRADTLLSGMRGSLVEIADPDLTSAEDLDDTRGSALPL